jgi:thiol-disulfide isomerase/thioredoxin
LPSWLGGKPKVELTRGPLSPESADAYNDLLGNRLQSHLGFLDTVEALENATAVGLYFAAEWCAPCWKFTPSLAKAYEKSLVFKGLKVVVVSADPTEEEFLSYFKKMPMGFYALPYAARDTQKKLCKQYRIQGFPTFVILDLKAQTITMDGKKRLRFDPTGDNYPWPSEATAAEVMDASARHSFILSTSVLLVCSGAIFAVRRYSLRSTAGEHPFLA